MEIQLNIIEKLGQCRIIKGKKNFNPVLLINKHFYTLKKTPCKFCFSGMYKPHRKRWHTITCDTCGHLQKFTKTTTYVNNFRSNKKRKMSHSRPRDGFAC